MRTEGRESREERKGERKREGNLAPTVISESRRLWSAGCRRRPGRRGRKAGRTNHIPMVLNSSPRRRADLPDRRLVGEAR